MNKNEPKQESNQAILARVKKEMDEPRMAESTRGEDINQTTRQKLKSCQSNGVKESQAVRAQRMLPREENNGKVNRASS